MIIRVSGSRISRPGAFSGKWPRQWVAHPGTIHIVLQFAGESGFRTSLAPPVDLRFALCLPGRPCQLALRCWRGAPAAAIFAGLEDGRVARLFFNACIMSITGALPAAGATATVLPLSLASLNWLRRSWNSSL